jgi:uncharacterized membrane protein
MLERSFILLQLPAAVGTGLIAGTFFCFSSFVVPALAKLEPTQGIAAMQKINIAVINPLFMIVLFGTAIILLLQSYFVFSSVLNVESAFWLFAAFFYVIGTIGITLFCNVPLNDQLVSTTEFNSNTRQFWASYVTDWTFWNSLRALTATAACAASIVAVSITR